MKADKVMMVLISKLAMVGEISCVSMLEEWPLGALFEQVICNIWSQTSDLE